MITYHTHRLESRLFQKFCLNFGRTVSVPFRSFFFSQIIFFFCFFKKYFLSLRYQLYLSIRHLDRAKKYNNYNILSGSLLFIII